MVLLEDFAATTVRLVDHNVDITGKETATGLVLIHVEGLTWVDLAK